MTTIAGLVSGKAYNLTVSAVDAAGNESTRSNLINTRALQLPTISLSNASVSVVATHPMISIGVYATGVPTPSITMVTGPSGLTFDPVTRLASWIPTMSKLEPIRPRSARPTRRVSRPYRPLSPLVRIDLCHRVRLHISARLIQSHSPSRESRSTFSSTSRLAIRQLLGALSPDQPAFLSMQILARSIGFLPLPKLEQLRSSIELPTTRQFRTRVLNVTVHPLGTDLRPPAPVSGIAVSSIDSTRALASWAPSSDNAGIRSYQITASYRYQAGAFNAPLAMKCSMYLPIRRCLK